MKRGSALVFALWVIAVLSVMAISFAYEARQQTGINVYVQRRNRVSHLIDAGRIIAETILAKYKDIEPWNEDQDAEQMLEDDAWFREKQMLKSDGRCKIGPVYIDDDDPENSLVTIEIKPVNSGGKGMINVNELYGATDPKINERWWMIFASHDIPQELDTPEEGRINLWNVLIASWNDWRDEDDNETQIDGKQCGAENDWYEEMEEKFKGIDDEAKNELKRRPRQGPIPDIRELEYVRGFRDYPQVLTGGVINPWEDEKDQIKVRGITDVLGVDGTAKININNCDSIDAIMTIPGVYDDPSRYSENEMENSEGAWVVDAREIAEAVKGARAVEPEDDNIDKERGEWPIKDWNDLLYRIDRAEGSQVKSGDIDSTAQNYITFGGNENELYSLSITGEAGGMKRTIEAQCYVKDGKIRYVKWSEP